MCARTLAKCTFNVCRHCLCHAVYISSTTSVIKQKPPVVAVPVSLQFTPAPTGTAVAMRVVKRAPVKDFIWDLLLCLCPQYPIIASGTSGILTPAGPPISGSRQTSTGDLAEVCPPPRETGLPGFPGPLPPCSACLLSPLGTGIPECDLHPSLSPPRGPHGP